MYKLKYTKEFERDLKKAVCGGTKADSKQIKALNAKSLLSVAS